MNGEPPDRETFDALRVACEALEVPIETLQRLPIREFAQLYDTFAAWWVKARELRGPGRPETGGGEHPS
jgi:hypothetical protein